MRTRILPALVLLPLVVAGCAEIRQPEPQAQAAVAAETAAAAPVTVAAVPAARPTLVTPLAPEPATPVTTTPRPPSAPPTVTADLGAAPPPAAEPAEEAEEATAQAPSEPASPGRLGTTVASLGSPTQGGLWLETALVDAPTSGRVEYNGKSVTLELRPSGGEPGSGSQISLDAMRALGAPLTGLPELTVYAG